MPSELIFKYVILRSFLCLSIIFDSFYKGTKKQQPWGNDKVLINMMINFKSLVSLKSFCTICFVNDDISYRGVIRKETRMHEKEKQKKEWKYLHNITNELENISEKLCVSDLTLSLKSNWIARNHVAFYQHCLRVTRFYVIFKLRGNRFQFIISLLSHNKVLYQ